MPVAIGASRAVAHKRKVAKCKLTRRGCLIRQAEAGVARRHSMAEPDAAPPRPKRQASPAEFDPATVSPTYPTFMEQVFELPHTPIEERHALKVARRRTAFLWREYELETVSGAFMERERAEQQVALVSFVIDRITVSDGLLACSTPPSLRPAW